MLPISCALALLSGVVGAGFASGRELAYFFAGHGAYAFCAVLLSCAAIALLFCRLPAQLERAGAESLLSLCRVRFGRRFGRLCAGLFFLLFAVTGGAMLAACAELAALVLPLRHAYGLGMLLSLIAAAWLAARGLSGLALPGAVLCVLLPLLLVKLLLLPTGEAAFAPAGHALHAAASGLCYGALNAAMVCGTLPLLLPLTKKQRLRAALLFSAMLMLLLTLGVLTLGRHRQAAAGQALPLVYLSRSLGKSGYYLCACTLYAAALSTLCAMLVGLSRMLSARRGMLLSAALCLLFASAGFTRLIERAYPTLGWLCAALLALLCLPLPASGEAKG